MIYPQQLAQIPLLQIPNPFQRKDFNSGEAIYFCLEGEQVQCGTMTV